MMLLAALDAVPISFHLSAYRTLEKRIMPGCKDRYLGGSRFRT